MKLWSDLIGIVATVACLVYYAFVPTPVLTEVDLRRLIQRQETRP